MHACSFPFDWDGGNLASGILVERGESLTLKQKLFVEAYLGQAGGNATEAAKIAGYRGDEGTLAQVGYENLRKPEIRAAVEARVQRSAMETDEVLNELSKIARMDVSGSSALSSKVRALEILAKIHGMMSDKLNLNLDRATLNRELDSLIEGLTETALRERAERGTPPS